MSTAVLVMARELAWGMKRKERFESSDLSRDTEKLVMRAQTPPGNMQVRNNWERES